jgi:hypothetical protein
MQANLQQSERGDDSTVLVRPYEAADRRAVRELLQRTFGDSLGFDRFESGNPLGEMLAVVATLNDRVVGFNQWRPWRVPGPRDIVAFQSGSSVIANECRGAGVFGRLLAEGEAIARARGAAFFLGFPNGASLGSFLRAGWSCVGTLDLRCALIPSFGAGKQAVLTAREAGMSGALGFHMWRYDAAEVESRSFKTGGAERIVFFRKTRAIGVPAIKLLDVLTPQGDRPSDLLRGVARALPGVRLVTFRVNRGISGAPHVPIPRAWKTPVVIKRLEGHAEDEQVLARSTFMYGDIDAA